MHACIASYAKEETSDPVGRGQGWFTHPIAASLMFFKSTALVFLGRMLPTSRAANPNCMTVLDVKNTPSVTANSKERRRHRNQTYNDVTYGLVVTHKITHPQDRFSKLGYSPPTQHDDSSTNRHVFGRLSARSFPTTPCLISALILMWSKRAMKIGPGCVLSCLTYGSCDVVTASH